ncbi:hypothetical protein LEN26_013790 [Aphanomyces euteiches]|nr:hypothetical protein LEN26_013790 [Aphanomyces euteiches]
MMVEVTGVTQVVAGLHEVSFSNPTTGVIRTFNMSRREECTPRILPRFDQMPLAKVAHGDRHAGLLLQNGQVWTWGNGSCALGLGIDDENHPFLNPVKIVRGLARLFVFDIAIGGWHSAALAIPMEEST